MSAITIDDDLVHYEALGRGKPVVLVHGWLGSWRYWVPAMRQLAGKYRTYAVDLWGFGDSARDTQRYNFEAQVTLLGEFMDRMGIKKAALVGHDFGGAVVARYAANNPDRVPRLMTVAPPLFRLQHRNLSLTQNPPKNPAAAPDAGKSPAKPDADAAKPPVFSEAETVPWRDEDMKARIRATIERQAKLPEASEQSNQDNESGDEASKAQPKTPREAAIPPADQGGAEAGPPADAAPPLPDAIGDVPEMPKLDYVPGDQTLQMRRINPLKEHLASTDRFKLLETHVDPTTDRKKLRDEVEKTDPLAFSMTIESFGLVDTLGDLRKLSMPQMLVYGAQDTFLPQPDKRMLEELASDRNTFAAMVLANNKHFPMLEEKAAFTRLLMEFLEASDVTKVKLTEVWERRVR